MEGCGDAGGDGRAYVEPTHFFGVFDGCAVEKLLKLTASGGCVTTLVSIHTVALIADEILEFGIVVNF